MKNLFKYLTNFKLQKKLKPHVGLPLAVMFSEEGEKWGGRSNFFGEVTLTSLQDCFDWLEKWETMGLDVSKWFVYDGSTNILYLSDNTNEPYRIGLQCVIQYSYLYPTIKIGKPEIL